MSALTTTKSGSVFDRALATVESLALDEQESLVEVVQKRIASAHRAALAREVTASRRDYHRGHVCRGTASDLMAELRRT